MRKRIRLLLWRPEDAASVTSGNPEEDVYSCTLQFNISLF